MKSFGLARIGRDAEVRHTSNGDAVVSLSLAFTYGRKGEDGKRPTQWVDAALWGKRAEALAPYLLKGGQISVTLEDVHIETYQGKNGEAFKLAGKVMDIELAGGGERQAAPAQHPTARPPVAPAPSGSGFDDIPDDDIPFVSSAFSCDTTTSKARRMAKYNY
jgi:single-strand DNA-binding protein